MSASAEGPRPSNISLAARFQGFVRVQTWSLTALLLVSAALVLMETAYLAPTNETLRIAVRAVRLSHVAMIDQETGIRGYLLTDEERFLEPYHRGKRELAYHTEVLTDTLAAFPDLSRDYLRVRLAQESWLNGFAQPALSNPDKVRRVDRDKELFDEYRKHERRLQTDLDTRVNGVVRLRRGLMVTGGVVQLVLFIAVLVVSRRRLRSVEQAIVLPVMAVLDAIKGVRDGRLEPVKRASAPVELEQIQEGLDQMIHGVASERSAREERQREAVERAAMLRQILDSAREFSGTLNLRYVLRTLSRAATTVAGASQGLIWLFDEDGKLLHAVHDTNAGGGQPVGQEAIEIGSGLVGRSARYARTVTPDAPLGHPEAAPSDELAVPLIVGARVVGVLHLLGPGTSALPRDRQEILEILASHGATAIESSRLHQAVEERSQRDALTKLFNRRRLEEDLDAEFKRCNRYARPLSFVMLDVDHFKRFNDTYGHARGDEILEELGRVLESSVRSTDTAYRYGGEEFSVLLRETPLAGAGEFAERLRRRIEGHFQQSHPASPVTSSIGVASVRPEMRGPTALVEAADRALYEAKRQGRNRVAVTGQS